MDEINANLGPDPETGGASVQSDRLRPIIRLVRRSNARWPAGLVVAIIVVLAASGLAFAAQMVPVLHSGSPAASQMTSPTLTV